MAAGAGVMAILESTYNSLDLDTILELYADDARFSAHCEFSWELICPPLIGLSYARSAAAAKQ